MNKNKCYNRIGVNINKLITILTIKFTYNIKPPSIVTMRVKKYIKYTGLDISFNDI